MLYRTKVHYTHTIVLIPVLPVITQNILHSNTAQSQLSTAEVVTLVEYFNSQKLTLLVQSIYNLPCSEQTGFFHTCITSYINSKQAYDFKPIVNTSSFLRNYLHCDDIQDEFINAYVSKGTVYSSVQSLSTEQDKESSVFNI